MPTVKKTVTRKPRTVKASTAKPVVRKPAVHRPVKKQVVEHPVIHRERKPKATYVYAVGRRKEAVARVRWHANEAPAFVINGRPMTEFFPTFELQHIINQPLVLTHNDKVGNVTAKVHGGGSNGQAEAVRLGIARALVKVDPDLRIPLKRAGFLRRDPRAKERKKYGLKRARRAPQWQKR